MKLAITRNAMGTRMGSRGLALGLAASMVAPSLLAGCGGGNQQAQQPAMGNYNPNAGGQRPAMQGGGQGMSTKKKALLLGGAALAYYLYKRKRDANNKPLPSGVQLYRSKNGGIYYRDARNPQVPIYVVPPSAQQFNTTMQVDPSEVQGLGLEGYQGYGGSSSGTTLDSVRNLIPLR